MLRSLILTSFLVQALACDPGPPVGTNSQSISTLNRLSLNRLSLNRLSLNRLSLNRLSLNRLSLNRLSLNRLSLNGLEDTVEGRELLHYVALCALGADEILVVETTESGTFENGGLFGLAPSWESGPLPSFESGMVSACLLAHVNAYDKSVPISIRDATTIPADATERRAYSVYEGTFFGDVFAEDQELYACTGELPSLARRLSPARADRSCADDTTDCGIEVVGRCFDVCATYSGRYGWDDCTANGVLYPATVSVYLTPVVDSDTVCSASGSCKPKFDDKTAILDASFIEGALASKCTSGAACSLACEGGNNCEPECSEQSECSLDCLAANNCGMTCKSGASCETVCSGANSCDSHECTSGASCLIECRGANNCGFAECDGEQTDCGNGTVVCNRACPTSQGQGQGQGEGQ